MTTVIEITRAIRHLSPDALHELRTWFEHFDAAQWDVQLETDILAGRLDRLADEALRADQHQQTKPL